MKDWYLKRDDTEIQVVHQGKKITSNSLLWLTPKQAAQHKKALVESDAPNSILDCAFPFDYEEWEHEFEAKKNLSAEVE